MSIEQIDPHEEALGIVSQTSRERIESTAKNCAELIWMPLQEEWWKRFPLLEGSAKATRGRVVAPAVHSSGVRLQHFSPVFSNWLWANGQNQVRVYSLAIDHRIVAKDVGYRTWAREPFLYSQELERLFGLVEGDAKIPYMKLLQIQPFSEDDRRHWVAFLATQMFRTPWFIAQNLAGLKKIVEARSIRYPTDIGSLRRAYETLFKRRHLRPRVPASGGPQMGGVEVTGGIAVRARGQSCARVCVEVSDFGPALTPSRLRRWSRRGRSPFALAVSDACRERDRAETRRSSDDHHRLDRRAALGSVKARRLAPPARRAAGGLDGTSAQPEWLMRDGHV